MAGVGQVMLDGVAQDITAANHYRVLQERKTCSLDGGPIDEAQIKQAEKFASQEELEELYYSENESEERGEGDIEDVDKAEDHGSQAGNVAGITAGFAGLLAAAIVAIAVDGFSALAISIVEAAGGVLSIGAAKLYDNGYDDRVACNENADSTNETLDGYKETLENSMDSMNEDYAEYADISNNYMLSKNDITNQIAMLTMDLESAKSGGNVQRAAEIETQIAALQGADLSAEEGAMEDIKGRLDEYSSANGEAVGAAGAADTVAGFLKQGDELGTIAYIDAAMLGLIGLMCTNDAAGIFGKALFDNVVIPAAKILFAVAAASFGISTSIMTNKAKKEFECHDAGAEMSEHIGELNSTADSQSAYVDQTGSDYADADEASAEGQAEASEAADEAVETHNEGAAKNKPETTPTT